jgi:integrase/recombinase XerD
MAFTGIEQPVQFRVVTRAHTLAWRAELEKQNLASASIRRKLAALYDYLCECNAVTHNLVRGVRRPKVETSEGKTPALSDAAGAPAARRAPSDILKGRRDRAILR